MSERFKGIKAFAFDVDGVFTDGGILAMPDGDLLRVFDAKDAFAVRMASMHGYALAIITGGRSESILKRFMTCGLKEEDVYLGSRDKIKDFNDFCQRHNLKAEDVMYFGDDVPDIPVMLSCGCGVCPSDAADDVRAIADFVSDRPAGKGTVRSVIEKVMKLQDTWKLDIELYEKNF